MDNGLQNCDLRVRLGDMTLRNPVIPASGTFGFGLEMKDVFDLNLLGGISLKGTTREARFGNPTPRIAECREGMINSVGLQNPGIEALVGEKAPALRAAVSPLKSMWIAAAARMPAKPSICSKSMYPAPMSTGEGWPSEQILIWLPR